MINDQFFVKFETQTNEKSVNNHQALSENWLKMDSVSGCHIRTCERVSKSVSRINPARIGALLMYTRQKALSKNLQILQGMQQAITRIIIHRMRKNDGGWMLAEETIIAHPRVSYLLQDEGSTVVEFRDFSLALA